MPVTTDKPAPYAPASAILGLIDHHRNKGLRPPVTAEVLARTGVSESLIPRTLYALQVLDLIKEDGSPTEVLEGLRLAREPEFKDRMGDWLNAAYADALSYVDPATADDAQLRDAFRSYNPVGQQARMVTLFTGLFAAAGIGPEKPPRQPVTKKSTGGNSQPAKRERSRRTSNPATKVEHSPPAERLPPPISGLLAKLPDEKDGWTQERRDSFVATFGAVLDFCFPIVSQEQSNEKTVEKEDVEE